MKKYSMLIIIYFISIVGFSQQLQLEKASPFTAVKWKNEQPIVQFENEWFTLKKLDGFTTQELLAFCKQKYGDKWQRRFSEDLVEVLKEIGEKPNQQVDLILAKDNELKKAIGTYTLQNRQKVLKYNHSNSNSIKKLTISQAIEDIEQFQQILENRSSYVHLSDYNYQKALQELKNRVVLASKKEVDVNFLTYELAKIMGEIGDRHSSVKNEGFLIEEYPSYTWQLPFIVAPLNGKAIALQNTEKQGIYKELYPNFPYLKSINNKSVSEMINMLAYKSKKAPKEARLTRGLLAIQQLGKLYVTNNLKLNKQVHVVFTNGKTDTTVTVQLKDKKSRYYSKVEQNSYAKAKAIKEGNFNNMATLLKENIGYIAIPEMYAFSENNTIKEYLDASFSAFENTKALIIDLRFNPGGHRDLIQHFASYILPKSKSPWVANVAYLRTDQKNETYNSMEGRFLYPISSDKFNKEDKEGINNFTKNFEVQKQFDSTKFSKPHYMLLKSGKISYTKPVYILVNEHSFSAASVFTSAFKGLSNVKIVGTTTDGSSGNSTVMHLTHSKIRVKLSTMLSFQRNGKTLDGNGTKPDISIPEDKEQVLIGKDLQLKKVQIFIDFKKDI